ncbi:MAG: anti-sigma factor antagonist [Streptosporangiaceae bacterium]|nr:anti-anti-sigma factor family protein [Streptosporangiaceae bacterium]MDX6428146.1 anti-sigma factor antagonist [Streptosporangiaceae bacterium]
MESALNIQLTRLTAYAVATLVGEIDFTNRERLEVQLLQALDTTRTALIVDMAEVTFCDSSGLNTFVRVLRRTRVHGKTLVLVGVHHRVTHVFKMTGLEREIPRYADVETAFRWLEGIDAGPDSGSAS